MKTITALLIVFIGLLTVDMNAQPNSGFQERVRNLKKVKLLEYLDLEEDKADKLIVKFNSLEGQLENAQEELRESVSELEKAIEDEESEARIKGLSQNVKLQSEAMIDLQKVKMDEIENILDDTEFAKYLVFEHNFRKELRQRLTKANRKRNNR